MDGLGTKLIRCIVNWCNGRRFNAATIQQFTNCLTVFMKMELRKSFQFEAAHLLPLLPKAHKCRRLHGHSFKMEIVVAGVCDEKLETKTAAARGSHRGRDLHGAGGLSRRMNSDVDGAH